MNGEPLTRTVTITNPMGFHLRPMAAFAKLASTFQSSVNVAKGPRKVNGKSLLELMLVAAEAGTELIVEVQGDDAPEALEVLAALLAMPAVDEEPDAPP